MRRVIVIGGGKMVYFLSKEFASKGYQLTIINNDRYEAKTLSRQLKATVILGDGSVPATQDEAGARRADVLLSLTPHDEDNLVACQLAQKMFGVPRTIALVNDPENQDVFHKLGISAAFSATPIIAKLIEEQTSFEDIINLMPIAEGRINVTEVVLRTGAPAVGKSLQELHLPRGALITTILRGDAVIVPGGDSRLRIADRLVVIAQPENYGEVLRLLTGTEA